MMGQARGVQPDADERGRLNDGDDHRLEREVRGIQYAKRRTRIENMREVQQPGYDRYARILGDGRPDDRFRQLIECDDEDR
jgi:hypothetical protein